MVLPIVPQDEKTAVQAKQEANGKEEIGS